MKLRDQWPCRYELITDKLCFACNETMATRRNKALVGELSNPASGTNDLYFPTQFSESSWGQFKACLWKQWWTYWRSPDYNLVRFFFTLVTALLLGSIFWRIGHKRYVDAGHAVLSSLGMHRDSPVVFLCAAVEVQTILGSSSGRCMRRSCSSASTTARRCNHW